MLIDLKPIYKVSSHPFVLSVLVLDAFGGGCASLDWGGGSPVLKSSEIFVESADFS